jgi:hypothetical protein
MISPGWFIWHALVGIAIGYGLRVFEHVVWSGMQYEQTGSTFGFAMMIIPPSLVVGATLGYISLVLLAPVLKEGTAIDFAAIDFGPPRLPSASLSQRREAAGHVILIGRIFRNSLAQTLPACDTPTA